VVAWLYNLNSGGGIGAYNNSYQEAYWLPLGKPLAVRFDSLLSNHHAFRDCKIFPTPHALMAPSCTFFQIQRVC